MDGLTTPTELPAFLQEKYEALEITNKHIKDLKSQLDLAKETRKNLLKEINAFRQAEVPISKLPLDVLPTIFEYWDEDPYTRNRTLSLVCKTWYETIFSSTAFWSNIVIRFDWDLRGIRSLLRFAELCHQRSGDKPLNIILDLRRILPYANYIAQILDRSSAYFRIFVNPVDKQAFSMWTSRTDNESLQPPYPNKDGYNEVPQIVFRRLIRQAGVHTGRWRSLVIHMPNHLQGEFVREALSAFKGNFDALMEFQVQGGPYNNVESPKHYLPVCPNLRHFSTNQNLALGKLPCNVALMETMCLDNNYNSWSFMVYALHARFDSLHTLELKAYIGPVVPDGRKVPLQQLVSLRLSATGAICQTILNGIDAPKLMRLHLQQFTGQPFEPPVTELLSNVKTLLLQSFGVELEQARKGNAALARILRQTQSLNTLTIIKNEWPSTWVIEEIVKRLKSDGYPLTHLNEIIIFGQQDNATDRLLAPKPEDLTILRI